jgi:hypothetical protein
MIINNRLRPLLFELQQAETELIQLRTLLKADSTRESTRLAYDRAYGKVKKLTQEIYGFNVPV